MNSASGNLLTREIEVIFLEALARRREASAWTSTQLSEVDVLNALRRRMPRTPLTVQDVLTAAQGSPALTCRSSPPSMIDGQLSKHVLHCNPRKLPGVTATSTQADFGRIAREFNRAGRQPLAGLTHAEVVLKPRRAEGTESHEGVLTVRNAGYGRDEDIRIIRVLCPPWLISTVDGQRVVLRTNPAFNGCYRGPVTVETTAGKVEAQVTARHWHCPPITADPVDWRTLVTRHAQLDEQEMIRIVADHLNTAGYLALTGGFFTRVHPDSGVDDLVTSEPTCSWTITAKNLKEARLPAQGHLPLVRLYTPDGLDRYDVPFDGQALHGEALAELFLMWEVKAGKELHLTPFRGHYQFEVRRPDTWLNLPAREYRMVTTLQALNRTPHFWDHLEEWLVSTPVQMLVQGEEIGLLRELKQRFPEHLNLRVTQGPIGENRLYFITDEGTIKARGLPEGQPLRGASWPDALWEQATKEVVRTTHTGQSHPTKELGQPSRPAVSIAASRPAGSPDGPDFKKGLTPYLPWRGVVAHPLAPPASRVLQSIKDILRVEGPMVGHHLLLRYAEALQAHTDRVPLSRMQLKRELNPLLHTAVQRGELLAEDEFGTGGQIGLVYRLPDQDVRPRLRGDRPLSHIPNSELRAVIEALMARPNAPTAEVEQAGQVLEAFGFGRFIEGGINRVRPLLQERATLESAPSRAAKRRRVR